MTAQNNREFCTAQLCNLCIAHEAILSKTLTARFLIMHAQEVSDIAREVGASVQGMQSSKILLKHSKTAKSANHHKEPL